MEKKKILIVEDEMTMRQALEETMVDGGFQAVSAEDGEVGLEAAVKHRPDLILLDIILPKKDGFEVLGELKSREETAKIPVILCTNLSQPEDVQRAVELGAKTYLVKSNYKLSEILEKVREIIK